MLAAIVCGGSPAYSPNAARVNSVYGYMADEFAGYAPTSLRMPCDRLGLPSVDPHSRWPQPALF